MSQLALDYGPSDHARLAWRRQLDMLRGIVARVGPKEVAFALDTSPSHLADALAERDRRGVRAEWIPTLLLLADDGERAALLGVLAAVAGYEVKRAAPATPAEQLARLIDALDDELAPAAKARVLKKASGGR